MTAHGAHTWGAIADSEENGDAQNLGDFGQSLTSGAAMPSTYCGGSLGRKGIGSQIGWNRQPRG